MIDGSRFCAYLRKSRADEFRESMGEYETLGHHRQALEALASKLGITVSEWYCEIGSAESIADRPQMQRLLSDIRYNRWDGVLCMEVERLTRGDPTDQGEVGKALTYTDTLVITPQKVYDPRSDADMEYFEFGLFMSRREYKTIKKRLVAGRLASVREGQYIGKDAPFGYRKATVNGLKTLEPDENAPVVRMIWEWYAEGTSYRDIAGKLNAMGVPPLRSKHGWHPASVRNIVLNDVYLGKVRWNTYNQKNVMEDGLMVHKAVKNDTPDVFDGLHPAIIDDELAAKARSRTASAPVRGAYQPRNPYAGLVYCERCGISLKYGQHRSEPYLLHHRYRGCDMKGCKFDNFSTLFIASMKEACADLELALEDTSEERTRVAEERKRIELEVSKAKEALSGNLDRLERGILSEREFVERRAVLNSRIEAAERALSECVEPSEEEQAMKIATVHDALNALGSDDVPIRAKNQFLKRIVSRVEYRNDGEPYHDDLHIRIILK